MSDLVGNPEDRFSRVEAQIVIDKICRFYQVLSRFLMQYAYSKALYRFNASLIEALEALRISDLVKITETYFHGRKYKFRLLHNIHNWAAALTKRN